MEIYLIRHAQSQNNALPVEQRVEDPPITELGREQARVLAEWIPALKLDKLITSPFRRALQTAERIHAKTGLIPEVRIDPHEQGGCYHGYHPESFSGRPGMTRDQIEREFPEFKIAADIDGDGWWKSRAYEFEPQAIERIAALLPRLRTEFAATDLRVGIVTHGDFTRLLVGQIDAPPAGMPRNVAVSKFIIHTQEIRLARYDNVDHLPPHLVTG